MSVKPCRFGDLEDQEREELIAEEAVAGMGQRRNKCDLNDRGDECIPGCFEVEFVIVVHIVEEFVFSGKST